MVIKIQIRICLLALACINFSCNSTSGLFNALSRNKKSLAYIYKSKPESNKIQQRVTLSLPTVTDVKFSGRGNLERLSSRIVPLGIYNEWKAIYYYKIGKDVIKEDVPSFIQTSFQEESKRSGIFVADTTATIDGLTLEIEVDSLNASGPYVDQGQIVFVLLIYSYSFSEIAGPGMAYSRFRYKLKRGDEVLLSDYVQSKYRTQPLVTHVKNLRDTYTTSLVEVLSQTFKSNLEAIVKDLNIYFTVNSGNH